MPIRHFEIRRELSQVLGETAWYRALSEEDQLLVQRTSSEKWVAARETIVRAGDPSTQWLGVIEGLIQMYIVDSSGRDTILSCIKEGEWCGEGSLLKREPRRYHAIALCPSRIALVSIETFHYLRDTSIAFNHYLQDIMNARMSSFISTLAADRLLSPELRVAKCLERMCHNTPHVGAITLAIPQQELALVCGLSRQRTNAALGVLENLGHIRVQFKNLIVLSLAGLSDYASSV